MRRSGGWSRPNRDRPRAFTVLGRWHNQDEWRKGGAVGRVLMFVVPLALTIYALVDCLQTEESAVRSIPKLGWVALIVLVWVARPPARPPRRGR